MDQILNKVGSYWIGQRANKEFSSVGDDINSLSTSIEGGAKWLVGKIKGKMQKPLVEFLKEYDLPAGIFPRDATNYEFNEETKRLTVYIPLICEVGYKDSSVLRFSTAVTGYLEKGKLSEIEGIKTKVIVWVKPFEEVKNRQELAIPLAREVSLARQGYTQNSEAAINEQINVEYNVSYVYHAMYAYFDRDNVALKGLAKFFKESSEEEREHAEMLMEYQNKRGGRVKLHSIQMPPSEYDHAEKGDALYAMELALSLEKLTNEKLLQVHKVANENNDPEMADFIESEFLSEQVEAIKKISDYVSQLRRVGKGHGVWHFDQMLLH